MWKVIKCDNVRNLLTSLRRIIILLHHSSACFDDALPVCEFITSSGDISRFPLYAIYIFYNCFLIFFHPLQGIRETEVDNMHFTIFLICTNSGSNILCLYACITREILIFLCDIHPVPTNVYFLQHYHNTCCTVTDIALLNNGCNSVTI